MKGSLMKKSAISFLLALVLVLVTSFSGLAFPSELVYDVGDNDLVAFNINKNGKIELDSHLDFNVYTPNAILNNSINEKVFAFKTKDPDIFRIFESNYIVKVNNENYQICKRISINSNYFLDKKTILANDIPESVVKDIEDTMIGQINIGNSDLKVELYAPLSNEEHYGPTYHYYSGWQLRDWITKYSSMYAETTFKGTGARDVASRFTDLVMNIGGLFTKNPIFGFVSGSYGIAQSLLEFANLTTVYGQSGDSLHVKIIYDAWAKHTQIYHNNKWKPGLNSRMVQQRLLEIDQFYGQVGRTINHKIAINERLYSPNYLYPGPIVVQWFTMGAYNDDSIIWVFDGRRFDL